MATLTTVESKNIPILDQEGVTTLAASILGACNDRIKDRIVDTIKADDTNHTPSANAVHTAVEEINTTVDGVKEIALHNIVQVKVPEGSDISKCVVNPNGHTLYMVRSDGFDKTATPYIYLEDGETFISGIPESIVYTPLTEEEIGECVKSAVESTDPKI